MVFGIFMILLQQVVVDVLRRNLGLDPVELVILVADRPPLPVPLPQEVPGPVVPVGLADECGRGPVPDSYPEV